MKKYYGILCLLVFTILSCSKYDDSEIWDYVKGMNSRLTALEEKCKEMNTNITSLQTLVGAFESGDYITNVTPVKKDGITIGYTISFLKSEAITIYNGTDGVNGTNGTNGYTPVIGVKKDTDGLYYWTVDGEWLLDDEGNKVRASAIDGQDGTNGTNGINGDNGITPLLKIENEYWYVSYDSGASWQELGKATGPKSDEGQSLFSSVEVNGFEVIFILTDGTTFSIPLDNSPYNNNEAVDLGLPSGTLWATCNVGADSPWEYGYYFSWGQTQSGGGFGWATYKYCNGTYKTLTKYCINSSYGIVDGKAVLEPIDDAATANWGEDWKMPSREQLEELLNSNYTTVKWIMLYGVNGIKITSKSNNKSIFLSAGGYSHSYGQSNKGEQGYYWSNELTISSVEPGCSACYMSFGSTGGSVSNNLSGGHNRCEGLSVRPVRKQ